MHLKNTLTYYTTNASYLHLITSVLHSTLDANNLHVVCTAEEIDILSNPDYILKLFQNWSGKNNKKNTMCDTIQNPVNTNRSCALLRKRFPRLTANFIDDVHQATSDGLFPHSAILPSVVVMAEMLRKEEYGLLEAFKAIRIPLSLVGQETLTRYRPPSVETLHTAWLPFAMAGRNCDLLDEVLAKHGMTIFRDCSCGIVLLRTEDALLYKESETRRHLNLFRSSLDRMGSPVVLGKKVPDITEQLMDVTPGEVAMFDLLDELLPEVSLRAVTVSANQPAIRESKEHLLSLLGLN